MIYYFILKIYKYSKLVRLANSSEILWIKWPVITLFIECIINYLNKLIY